MAQQTINVGAAPNDGTGDPLRTAMIKINDNFDEIYDGTAFASFIAVEAEARAAGDAANAEAISDVADTVAPLPGAIAAEALTREAADDALQAQIAGATGDMPEATVKGRALGAGLGPPGNITGAQVLALAGLGGGPLPGFRNKLINGDGAINQRGVTAPTDDTYAWDRWNVLTQTAAIGSTSLVAPLTGIASMMRLTQSQAAAQRMGVSQILEASETYALRGRTVTLGGILRNSLAAPVRFAVLEWTGTADAPVSDVVNSWTSTNYSAGNFFNASNLNVLAVGVVTPLAAAATEWSLSAVVGGAANNLIVMVWTEGTAAQNATLDLRIYLVVGGVTGEADPFSPRHRQEELALCQRYYERNSEPEFYMLVTASASQTNQRTVRFAVPKRIAPTIVILTDTGPAATGLQGSSVDGVRFFFSGAQFQITTYTWTASAEL